MPQEFCAAEGISYEICGKVIVALDEDPSCRLSDADLPERGQASTASSCEVIGRERLSELEPHSAGIKAIHVPEAGIVDYSQVCARLAARVQESDGQVLTSARVTKLERRNDRVIVTTTAGDVEASHGWSTAAGCNATRVDGLERREARCQDHPIPWRVF